MATKSTAKSPAKLSYVSNPFSVFINSFKALQTNLNTLLLLIAAALGTFLVAVIIGVFIAAMAADRHSAIGPLLLVVLIIPLIVWMVILGGAYLKYAIETARGDTVDFKAALKVGEHKAMGLIGLHLLLALIIIAGFILFIIPGFIFMYWYLFAPYVYIDQDVGIREALHKSHQLVKGKLAEILGLVGASFIFSLPSGVPFIGSVYQLIFTPVSQIAFAYRYASAQSLGSKSKPDTDSANYWGVAVLFLLPALFLLFTIIFGISAAFINGR